MLIPLVFCSAQRLGARVVGEPQPFYAVHIKSAQRKHIHHAAKYEEDREIFQSVSSRVKFAAYFLIIHLQAVVLPQKKI